MADFFSERFNKNVWLTFHAREMMRNRDIDHLLVLHIVENGNLKYKDDHNFWIYLHIDGRDDNLICLSSIQGDAIIIKTIMSNWKLEE